MEENGPGPNGTKTNARSTDSLEYWIKHYELQPWQENILRWYMEEPKARTRLLVYGRQCGKTQLQLEYMKLIGKLMEEEQDR